MTLRVAVVGAGFMASTHLDAYRGVSGCEPRWLCSRTEATGVPLAEKYGLTWTSDLDSLLQSEEVDALDVCLPSDLHVEFAGAGLESGKHVLVEKPIAIDLDGANHLVQLAARSRGTFMVGLVLRFWPEYVAMRRLVDNGTIGTARIFSGWRLSPQPDWNLWMADQKRSGGVIVDLMSHDLDQAIAVLGPVKKVHTSSAMSDLHALAAMEHADGFSVVEGSWAVASSYPFSCGFRVIGDGGVADYSFSAVPAGVGNLGGKELAGALRLTLEGSPPSATEVHQGDPFQSMLQHFAASSIASTEPEHGSAVQARDALAVAIAARESMSTGQPVEVLQHG